jgi:outer membrane protein assembly factor BamB
VLISACGEVMKRENGNVSIEDSSKINSQERSAKEKNRSQKVNLPDKNPMFREPINDNHELVDPDEEPITTNLYHIWTAKEDGIGFNKTSNYARLSHSGIFFSNIRSGETTPSTRIIDVRNGKTINSNTSINTISDINGSGNIKFDSETNDLLTLTDTGLSIENLGTKEKQFICLTKKDKNSNVYFYLDSCKRIFIQQDQSLERKLYDKSSGKLLYEFNPEDIVREYKNNYLILSYINEFKISISHLNIETKSIIWKKDIYRIFIDRFPLAMEILGDLLIIKYAHRGLFDSQNNDDKEKTAAALNYIRLNPDNGEFIWETQIKTTETEMNSAFALDYRKMFTFDGIQHFNPEDGSLTGYTYEVKSNDNMKNVLENKEYSHYLSKYNAQYLRASKSRLYCIRNCDFYIVDKNTGKELFAYRQNIKERYEKLQIADIVSDYRIIFIDRKIIVITFFGTYCFSETNLNRLSINHFFLYVDVPFFGVGDFMAGRSREEFENKYRIAKENILTNPPIIEITNTSKEDKQVELIPEEPFLKVENTKLSLKPGETAKIKFLINVFSSNKMGEIRIRTIDSETSVIVMTTNDIGGD